MKQFLCDLFSVIGSIFWFFFYLFNSCLIAILAILALVIPFILAVGGIILSLGVGVLIAIIVIVGMLVFLAL